MSDTFSLYSNWSVSLTISTRRKMYLANWRQVWTIRATKHTEYWRHQWRSVVCQFIHSCLRHRLDSQGETAWEILQGKQALQCHFLKMAPYESGVSCRPWPEAGPGISSGVFISWFHSDVVLYHEWRFCSISYNISEFMVNLIYLYFVIKIWSTQCMANIFIISC